MKENIFKNDIKKKNLNSTLQHLIKKNTTYTISQNVTECIFLFYCFLLHNCLFEKGKKKNLFCIERSPLGQRKSGLIGQVTC